MKNKSNKSFWLVLTLFSLIGQIAWVVENMYFNVFIYKMFNASAADISAMVSASAIAATVTTVFMGAFSDKIGKRKLFMCGGYILWGISIFSFALVRTDMISAMFPMVTSAASLCITLVIVLDCVMTFFGSTANDAAFNAWLTDSTDETNRGAAEGINSMMPLVSILAVFGGFMAFDLAKPESWTAIFSIIGAIVIVSGVIGIFTIKEPTIRPSEEGYISNIFYGFRPATVIKNAELYISLLAFIIFNISIQIFMPYLIIYYEVSLGMADYVLVMAPAIVVASVVTALWGKVYDKKGFGFAGFIAILWLALGYVMLYIFRAKLPVFVGSLFMMSGYLSGMAVFGAKIRNNTPVGKSGRFQGVRIFSQVLIPGVVGPFIGKTVLSGAETIVGSDGTESFVPNADIFLAALIALILLIPLMLLVTEKKKPRINTLETPYENTGDIPHNYYPRKQLQRDGFVNLNGKWNFCVVNKGKLEYEGEILVPFPPESKLSGVSRITVKNETLVYGRTFIHNKDPENPRTILHFGAVDCEAVVYVNGECAGAHIGGYYPFSVEITKYLREGENVLRVEVEDSLSTLYPYGKQKHKRGGMWYTPVSGIWQTVWLEDVPEKYIEGLKVTPTLDSVTIETTGGEAEKTVRLNGAEYRYTGDSINIQIDDPRLWTPESPFLYDFTVECGKDKISSYFALRTVDMGERNGQKYICLNGNPLYFHGLLDQGYYSDGIYTPGTEKAYEDDIIRAKELGFNMLRKHIKIEPDEFYYLCDKYGMLVFQDMVNNGRYDYLLDTVLPTIGIRRGLDRPASKAKKAVFSKFANETADLLYNHPSVVYYTIFNEGWGQHGVNEIYDALRKKDPTRIWDSTSGWFKGYRSDVQSEHIYFKPVRYKVEKHRPSILSEFGGYSYKINSNSYNLDKTYGYKVCKDAETFVSDLEKLYENEIIPMIEKGLCGSVLTQLTDVEDETNGLITYDRQLVKVDQKRMRNISEKLNNAFDKRV